MRLKIFILSTMLITLISGVLFYKNLTQIGPSGNFLKLDFEELRSIDFQVANTAFYLRKNINAEMSELRDESNRIAELVQIINDINKNTPELKKSVDVIKKHFEKRQKQLSRFEAAETELRKSVQALIPAYNDLEKKNIKYVLDKKDFYRECILDSYMYISFSHKENEMRLAEDQKILSQIINFSSAPVPELVRYGELLESIHGRVKEIDGILKDLKDENVSSEMKVIASYYQESLRIQSDQNENLLTFMFAAIGIYLLFMIFILRRN